MLYSMLKLAAFTAAIAVVIAGAYLVYLKHKVSKRVISGTKLFLNNIPPEIRNPTSIPGGTHRDDNNSGCIIAYERVTSHMVPRSHLGSSSASSISAILTRYIRATMTAFGNTPQVFLLKRMMPQDDQITARTFEREWIQTCKFDEGDRVNGVWRVVHRGNLDSGDDGNEERVELAIDPPAGYRGPEVQGAVVVGVQAAGQDHLVFVNETWMWRGPEEKAILLESMVGRWLHVLLSGWLVGKGVDALLGWGGSKGKEE